MKLYLGVDGGQSATEAVIGDESGKVLGRGEAGPCNHAKAGEGREKLMQAVIESVAEARRNAIWANPGMRGHNSSFEAACFGMSGGPEDKREIIASLIRTKKLIVTTDAVTALAGATESGNGVIVIAGTGSIAFGRNEDGKTARAGGWGYVFGDEGGAFDIVRQALRAALRMEEGWGMATALHAGLLLATGTETANDALHAFYTDQWPRSKVASLATMVDAAAIGGDPVAVRILDNCAQELATLAVAVRHQLWEEGTEVEVAYVGGVFESQRILGLFRRLVELDEGTRCRRPLRNPAEGALLEAIRSK